MNNWQYVCDVCGRQFPIWIVSDDEWNTSGFKGIVCKHCFEEKCENPQYLTAEDYINDQTILWGFSRDDIDDISFNKIRSKILAELLEIWDTPEETDEHMICRKTASHTKKACLVSGEQQRREKKFVEFVEENAPLDRLSEGVLRPLIIEKDTDIRQEAIRQCGKLVKDKERRTGKKSAKVTAKDVKLIIKDVKKEARKTETQKFIDTHTITDEPIYLCACADIDLPAESVDLIFTDPPYSPDFLNVYGDLAKIAAHVLKPGGLCIAYAGDMYLPDIINQMSPHLEWVMILNQYMPDSNLKIQKIHVYTVTRNIVVFKKSGTTSKMAWVPNTMKNERRSKEYHEWGQGVSAAEKYIEAYTEVGEMVLDPFVGGGTFVYVAKNLGRQYIGYDIDQHAVDTTIRRISE